MTEKQSIFLLNWMLKALTFLIKRPHYTLYKNMLEEDIVKTIKDIEQNKI